MAAGPSSGCDATVVVVAVASAVAVLGCVEEACCADRLDDFVRSTADSRTWTERIVVVVVVVELGTVADCWRTCLRTDSTASLILSQLRSSVPTAVPCWLVVVVVVDVSDAVAVAGARVSRRLLDLAAAAASVVAVDA